MLQGRYARKAIAATLLVLFANNTFFPGISYALTSGPTAPEATSFEPVDTTDMVNLQTGTFTYNLPLFEIPGPEGGYPLSLSYHAGIQPNEDASWVGLGWTLNPGTLNRTENGYADDYDGQLLTNRTYWGGGNFFSVGITVPLGGGSNASLGLNVSNDTYNGFNISPLIGLNFEFASSGTPLGDAVATPYLKKFLLGQKLTRFEKFIFNNTQAGTGIGFNINSNGITARLNSSFGFFTGASISTSGDASFGFENFASSSNVVNNDASKISSKGFSFMIPTPWFSLSFSKYKYWIDARADVKTHGSLYMKGNYTNPPQFQKDAFDNYFLFDYPNINFIDNPEPEKQQGGAYPAFDNYNVLGQGISGNIRPYLYQGYIVQQQKWKTGTNYNVGEIQSFIASPFSCTVSCRQDVNHINPVFRFVNDFSNSYRQPFSNYNASVDLRETPPPFAAPVYGNADGNYGYDPVTSKLAGSKDVTFFTNQEVSDGTAKTKGFIAPRNCSGYSIVIDNVNNPSFSKQIGGFSITNSSGVTYHYGLPAYSFEEIIHTEKVDGSVANGGPGGNELSKARPYAYTWYLTSITGPDFVDRNANGKADGGDWGYWINMNYGKWTDSYIWRNPAIGFHKDLDQTFQTFSVGKKEIYYLNTIESRTHTAIFEKDIRVDGKGSATSVYSTGTVGNVSGILNSQGAFNTTSKSSMKLNNIFIVQNENLPSDVVSLGNYNAYTAHLGQNVTDVFDIDNIRNSLTNNSLRVIKFNYDNSLCLNTDNSFDYANTGAKLGKLTLKSINILGKKGISLIPPTTFNYELSVSEKKSSSGSFNATRTTFTTTTSIFQPGDLLVAPDNTYCGAVTTIANDGFGNYVYTLANGLYTGSLNTVLTTSKNPAYNKDAYDYWGMYKSDYNTTVINQNENLGRQPGVVSSKATDAWSLRNITSATGSNINVKYESNEYMPIINNNGSILITNIGSTGGANAKVKIYFSSQTYADVVNNLSIGDKINFLGLQRLEGPLYSIQPTDVAYCPVDSRDVFAKSPTITAFNSSELSITTDADFYSYFFYSDLHGNPQLGVFAASAFVKGNLLLGKGFKRYGSGIRVSSITLNPGTSSAVLKVNYDYTRTDNGFKYGYTSYEPIVFDINDISSVPNITEDQKKNYKKALYKDLHYLLTISRELPPPGVMYQFVSVINSIKNPDEQERFVEGKTSYEFEVFNENMVGRIQLQNTTLALNLPGLINQYCKNLTIKNFTSSIGNLRRMIKYDNSGKKIYEIINKYLHDGLSDRPLDQFASAFESRLAQSQYNNQGVIKERYSEAKYIWRGEENINQDVKFTMSAREQYPNIQTGSIVIDYVNGTKAETTNLGFDFYSGAVIKTVETDSYGNNIMTEVVPAYRKYSAMGLRTNILTNKNMLTQVAGVYTYNVDGSNNKLGLVSATATTWSNQIPALGIDGTSYVQDGSIAVNGNVWRTQSSYSWLPDGQTSDGLTAIASFSDFNWASPASSNAAWKETSEITLYDVYSKGLEGTDINNNFSTSKMDFGDKKIVLTGSPAKFNEIAYSGAEDAGISQTNNMFVKSVDGTVSTAMFHTGEKSLLLGVAGKKGFQYTVAVNSLTTGRDYVASVWVKPISGTASDVTLKYDVNGVVKQTSVSSGSSTQTANGWYLVNLKINSADLTAGSTLNVYSVNNHASVQAYVDDFRFQPLDATSTAYVYDSFSGELTYVLDNNNIYTKYVYDAAGRLVSIHKEKLGTGVFKTNEFTYNYSAAKFLSSAITNAVYQKNDCSAGYLGSKVTINIPAGSYISYVSQTDAESQASQAAQRMANEQGQCLQAYTIPVSITGTGIITSLSFMQGSTFVAGGTFTSSGSIQVPAGTYTVVVSQTNNVSRSVTLPGYGTQTGTSASFPNVVIPGLTAISVQ